MLSSSRFKIIHSGLSSVAQKVYASVPISEAWSQSQIYAEMSRNSVSAHHRVMGGAINALITAGLITEPLQGKFRRVGVRDATEKKPAPEPEQTPTNEIAESRAMTTISAKTKPAAAQPTAPQTAIDSLGLLAARAAKMADDLRQLATDVGNAAVDAQMQMESSAEDTQKLRQLQAILKSVG
jgi:hypothetical protein